MPNIKQSKLDSLLRAAEVSCAENGARLTQRRRQVLSALMQSSSPLSAYEVLDLCNRSTASACLLYTSPSPRDRTRSRMPSSA